MDTVPGYTPIRYMEGDEEIVCDVGETPGTKAVVQAFDELNGLGVEDFAMADPGVTPKTGEIIPHSLVVETQLLDAAEDIRAAVKKLRFARGW